MKRRITMSKEMYRLQVSEQRTKAESYLSRIDWSIKSEDIDRYVDLCVESVKKMGEVKKLELKENNGKS